jgi:hypothetical protein
MLIRREFSAVRLTSILMHIGTARLASYCVRQLGTSVLRKDFGSSEQEAVSAMR